MKNRKNASMCPHCKIGRSALWREFVKSAARDRRSGTMSVMRITARGGYSSPIFRQSGRSSTARRGACASAQAASGAARSQRRVDTSASAHWKSCHPEPFACHTEPFGFLAQDRLHEASRFLAQDRLREGSKFIAYFPILADTFSSRCWTTSSPR
jgi:hypothetical protein